MKPLTIVGLAVPYNVPNSYNETMLPQALTEFVQVCKRRHLKIPMFRRHKTNHVIGYFTELHSTPKGLWVKGVVTDPLEIQRVTTSKEYKGLSVTFASNRGSRMLRANYMESIKHNRLVFDPLVVERSALAEISLTSSPAWQECFFQILGENR